MKPILFCNTGWMRKYQGLDKADDEIIGGGAYVKIQGYGHEILNFKAHNGYMYGFVQTRSGIDIQRLGASENDSKIDDTLVIWVARYPKGGTYIIGWYDKATIYSKNQISPQASQRVHNNEQIGYIIKAKQEDCVLLPIDKRTFLIPRQQKDGMGQSNIWYADKPVHLKFKKSVLEYIANGGVKKSSQRSNSSGSHSWQPDPHKRKKIELRAIETTISYYEKLGYVVGSVERDNVGWDLEANHDDKSLKLEVKGLSGSSVSIELTPNEYAKMKEYQNDYRICVVTNALTSQPLLKVFAFSHENKHWEDDDGNKLEVVESVSAKMSL